MKNVLLIEPGSELKRSVLEKLNESCRVYVAGGSDRIWVRSIISQEQLILTDVYNLQTLLSDIFMFLDRNSIQMDAVLTFYEHAVIPTAVVCNSLNLKFIDPASAIKSSTNKILMRSALHKGGVSSLKYEIVSAIDDLSRAIESVSVPCVIKPVLGSDSYGVRKISKKSDLDDYIVQYNNECSVKNEAIFQSLNPLFLVEEFCGGNVLSVDGIVNNSAIHIAGIIEIGISAPPYFIQNTNFYPSNLSEDEKGLCATVVSSAIKAIGLNNCAFHCEIKYSEGRAEIIEIAARPPGGHLIAAYSEALGIDFIAQYLNMVLDRPVCFEPGKRGAVIQKGVFIDRDGTLESVSGYENFKLNSAVFDFIEVTKPGEKILRHPENYPKPIYYYGLVGEDRRELEALARRLEGQVQLNIK